MPELPDIVVYKEALERRISGKTLIGVRLNSPFLLRTAMPPISSVSGKTARSVFELGSDWPWPWTTTSRSCCT